MSDSNKLARAYQEASSRLRRRHDDEFHAILAEVYADWGIEVRKRRSRRQAARQRLEEAQRVLDQS